MKFSKKLAMLITECSNPKTYNLDKKPLKEILQIMNREDEKVITAVRKKIKQIAKVCEIFIETYKSGGRIFFVGAGTSGRIAVQEAVECLPTFGVSPSRIQGIIAGGKSALSKSVEGAEDDTLSAKKFFQKRISNRDFIICISASSITPFVMEFIRMATKKKVKCALVTANPKKFLTNVNVDALVDVLTGPEVLTGSTRLKAGTATKLILNMITTASMTKLGKFYSNYMIDVKCYSKKLIYRAIGLITLLGKVSPKKARNILKKANYNTKIAILMARKNLDFKSAKRILKKFDYNLRPALLCNTPKKSHNH